MLPYPPTTQPRRPRLTIIDQTVELQTGREWDFPPRWLAMGQTYEIAWVGTVRAYVGLFPQASYQAMRQRGGPAPFAFGSDRLSSARQVALPANGWYHLVARVGVFTPPGRIRIGLYQV